MLINNFKNSGSAEGAVNYILSMKDHEGKTRSVAPKILEGDPQLTKDICKEFCSNFSHKTVSGVISFRDNEKPTDEQKMEVIKQFKKMILGKMADRTNCLFVEHNDKGNCEIHYVINRVDMGDGINLDSGGNYFNPFPPGDLVKDLMKLFSEDMNNKFGYKSVEEKPLKTKYSQDELKVMKKERHGIKNLKEKVKIVSALEDMVKIGLIKNRAELVEFLKDEGHTITRMNDDFISIKNPIDGERNIRFKGGIFAEHNGLDYKEVKELALSKPKLSNTETKNKLLEIVAKRDDYNHKRFGSKKSEPTTKKDDIPPGSGGGGSVPPSKPLQTPKTEPKTVSSPVPSPVSNHTEKASKDSPDPIGGNAVNSGLVGAQSAYDSALARLSSAKTYAERVKAQIEVIRAKIALDNAQSADLEQKNKSKVKI